MQETGVCELNCFVRVDEFGFFIYWKSDGRVSQTFSLWRQNVLRNTQKYIFFYR